MKIRIIRITRRQRGVARKEESLDLPLLTVGRGTTNSLQLDGLAVSLDHCELSPSPDHLIHAQALGGAALAIDGRRTRRSVVVPGSVLKVGGYELRVLPCVGDEQLCVEVEQVEIDTSDRSDETWLAGVGIDRGLHSRRVLSWIVVMAVTLVFILLPITTGVLHWTYSSGPLARKHATITADCQHCHANGFRAVQDVSCQACHQTLGAHTSIDLPTTQYAEKRCATCHAEHNGADGLVWHDQQMCATCHRAIHKIAPTSTLDDASDFATDHPEFRVKLVAQPGAAAQLVSWSPDLQEHSGLRFNHLRHVGQIVIDPVSDARDNLHCGTCHTPDAAGKTMLPVVFEKHCQRCHSLSFDDIDADRQALHGAVSLVREDLFEYYAARAYRGQVADPTAPESLRRARPGMDRMSEPDRHDALAWAQSKVELALDFLLGSRGKATCKACHEPTGTDAAGRSELATVDVSPVAYPKGEYSHGSHSFVACATCHPGAAVFDESFAGGAHRPAWSSPGRVPYGLLREADLPPGWRPSTSARDVLVPPINTCRACHTGTTRAGAASSDCVTCHRFHNRDSGAMLHSSAQSATSGN